MAEPAEKATDSPDKELNGNGGKEGGKGGKEGGEGKEPRIRDPFAHPGSPGNPGSKPSPGPSSEDQ
jgi:hypothetical protein